MTNIVLNVIKNYDARTLVELAYLAGQGRLARMC
jgi:hypothetical protein